MTSLLTNTSAMSALQTLRSINSEMSTTQGRISSGMKVGEASDNAAYWSIATTMRSDNKALSSVQDALGLGAAKIDTAYTGMNAAIEVVDEIKTKLVAASEPGVDKAKVQKEITQLQEQLTSLTKSSSFNGENWLYHDDNNSATTKAVVGSFNRDASNNVSLTTLDIDTTATSLIEVNASGGYVASGNGLLSNDLTYTNASGTSASLSGVNVMNLDITDMSAGDLSNALSGVDSVLQSMTDAAADLGAVKKRVEMQGDFVSDLKNSIDSGIGRLVDADMNEESTRLRALQTQQQLGIQSLSIANSQSQNILQLFG
ncbi:flagellin [Rhizobium sp. EC-SD404]|uniref:flagellin N-terminal helical domain-containing protein n=1 Tax=Rhizobium sp. EC-SD404 TaxID=2038389 RepID=UPI00125C362D|nr:flagellin [Rhizobium sp. EC-SD404]VVT32245.1 Flagellin A [Rhizobium sp. EC-SD404]